MTSTRKLSSNHPQDPGSPSLLTRKDSPARSRHPLVAHIEFDTGALIQCGCSDRRPFCDKFSTWSVLLFPHPRAHTHTSNQRLLSTSLWDTRLYNNTSSIFVSSVFFQVFDFLNCRSRSRRHVQRRRPPAASRERRARGRERLRIRRRLEVSSPPTGERSGGHPATRTVQYRSSALDLKDKRKEVRPSRVGSLRVRICPSLRVLSAVPRP